MSENNDGFSGMGFLMFLIFALIFGFNGNGFMGGSKGATAAEVQNGFNTSEITRKLDGITNGLADGFYAQNTNMLTGFSGVKETVWNEGRALQSQLAEYCCGTQRAIDGVKFDMANYAAAINANTTAQAQKVLDAISQNKVEALQGRVNQLELQSALCGVVRYPNAMTFNAGASPFFGQSCCGC